MCRLRMKLIVHHTVFQCLYLPLLMIVDTLILTLLHTKPKSYHIVIHAALIRAPANNSFSIFTFIIVVGIRLSIKTIHIHISFFLLLELFNFRINIFDKWQ